jgi:hypothetical protein
MKSLIGIDFSINKPALCVYNNNSYNFIFLPYDLSPKLINLYQDSGIQIVPRTDIKVSSKDLSSRMHNEIKNAIYLSNLIIASVKPYLNKLSLISFEGASFSSGGNIGAQLYAYKYILMNELTKYIPLENMYTYAPLTLKSIAGAAKKGMGKSEMITSFISKNISCKFSEELQKNPDKFKKKGEKNWIIGLDDIVDSFWALETLRVKNPDLCC